MGTSSIWWWGHPSPEAFTKFQHLKNAAFRPQQEFCISWRSTAPGPAASLPLTADAPLSIRTILRPASGWKPGAWWEGAVTLGSSGKGLLQSAANVITANIQPEEQKPGGQRVS